MGLVVPHLEAGGCAGGFGPHLGALGGVRVGVVRDL